MRAAKLFKVSTTLVADRGVPTRTLKVLFRSAREDVGTLQSFIEASNLEPGERPAPGLFRVHKRKGRPKAKRRVIAG